jgi:hypothetical protein
MVFENLKRQIMIIFRDKLEIPKEMTSPIKNSMIRGLRLGTEPDVISVGKSLCAKGLGSLLGSGPAVDAHSIEIVTKHRFMATAQNRRQRFTLIAIVKQLLGYHGFMSRASGAIRAVQP